jgi:hypothetical protein
MSEVVALIEAEEPSVAGRLTFEPQPLPFPADLDTTGLERLGPVVMTPFVDGVRETLARFRRLAADGRLPAISAGIEPR